MFLFEAMARAMPILVTDTGATRELVDAENGLILQKNDVQNLMQAMRTMIQMDHSQFGMLSAASLDRV